MNTPYYLYDLHLLRQTIESANSAAAAHNYKIHYAIKANNNPLIAKVIGGYDLGADCVSGNEVNLALQQGFKRENFNC